MKLVLPKTAYGLILGSLILSFALPMAFAHKGEDHGKKEEAPPPIEPSEDATLKTINEAYLKDVKPIFQKSCFDCHSNSTQYPWYSSLPGAKQLIRNDVNEAKTHLDMSVDFPFKSHVSPKEDLEAIRDSVQEGSMPPFRYRILHWASALDAKEKAAILNWTENSLKTIEGRVSEPK